MIATNPPSARARAVREAIARGCSPGECAGLLRDLSRAAEDLFDAARASHGGAGDLELAGTVEASDVVLGILSELENTLPTSPSSHALSALSFVERALRLQELSIPPAEPAERSNVGRPETAAPRRRGRALLVEDEPAFRRVAGTWLREAGFDVIEATRADDARQQLAARRWDLLFADVVLPGGGDGFDLAEYALQSNIGIAVVFATGFSPRPRPSELRSWPMLNKPFTRNSLLAALDQALGMTDAATPGNNS